MLGELEPSERMLVSRRSRTIRNDALRGEKSADEKRRLRREEEGLESRDYGKVDILAQGAVNRCRKSTGGVKRCNEGGGEKKFGCQGKNVCKRGSSYVTTIGCDVVHGMVDGPQKRPLMEKARSGKGGDFGGPKILQK